MSDILDRIPIRSSEESVRVGSEDRVGSLGERSLVVLS